MNGGTAKYPFKLPKRSVPDGGAGRYHPKMIHAWIEALPLTNLGDAAHEVFQMLTSINQAELAVSERFKNMELLRRATRHLLAMLDERLGKARLPLDEYHEGIARLVEQLQIKLFVGYKTVLEQLHSESVASSLMHRGMRLDTLHRLFFLLGQLQLSAYRLYRPQPPYFWREIHGLYHYACSHQLHHKVVANENTDVRPKSSIEEQYLQILLLELAHPYQLKQGEADLVHRWVQLWSGYCDMRPATGTPAADDVFVIAKGNDRPPLPGAKARESGATDGWVLDLNRLDKQLHDVMARQSGAERGGRAIGVSRDAQDELPADVLQRLIAAWGMKSERNEERRDAEGSVRVSIGLESIYILLGGESTETYRKSRESTTHEHEVTHVSEDQHRTADLLLEEAQASTLTVAYDIDMEEEDVKVEGGHWSDVFHHDVEVVSENCRIIDQSAGGYHLHWLGDNTHSPMVGELVGLFTEASSGSPGSWSVGVVRWIRNSADGNLRFGVQKLGFNIQPAILHRRHVRGGKTADYFYSALLLHDVGSELVTMISERHYDDPLDISSLIQHGAEQQIRIRQTVEQSAGFVWCEFKFMGNPELLMAPADDNSNSVAGLEHADKESGGAFAEFIIDDHDDEDETQSPDAGFEKIWRDI